MLQEEAAAHPAFPCCSARGSVVAVSLKGANRGQIGLKTYTVPEGYSGGGAWGGNFAVDPERGSVFASTGNNDAHPTAFKATLDALVAAPVPQPPRP